MNSHDLQGAAPSPTKPTSATKPSPNRNPSAKVLTADELLSTLSSLIPDHVSSFPEAASFTFREDEVTSTTELAVATRTTKSASHTVWVSVPYSSCLSYTCEGRSLKLKDFVNVNFRDEFAFVLEQVADDGKTAVKGRGRKKANEDNVVIGPWDDEMRALAMWVFVHCGKSQGFVDFGARGVDALVRVLKRVDVVEKKKDGVDQTTGPLKRPHDVEKDTEDINDIWEHIKSSLSNGDVEDILQEVISQTVIDAVQKIGVEQFVPVKRLFTDFLEGTQNHENDPVAKCSKTD
ncbi:hypothetical protein BU24DRAFT_73111 [Aaosphaeria arxii CBS 175.79]|uniref:Uncharacterized protein n=1 Tax=Aaosphaeria arxii CBS 175.79 TaxID=1450172 RepID=A0A6A5XB97_9PLEO|nr:uncharacterized protein BU24DRAFT_73111 [Aaosphaeria arxii CBS 175.79]KAF2010211.1 hypothetical protein BU24DRAFT_73111 [Aaosphaeria arxii CBS 175.79]